MTEITAAGTCAGKNPVALRPRDAATLLLIDRSGSTPRILMGKRHLSLVFMPGMFVFPGGRLDPSDAAITSGSELNAHDMDKLLLGLGARGSMRRARALALCAIRETFEETGLRIASNGDSSLPITKSPDWSAFFGDGFTPMLHVMRYFARAITPPGNKRRFDTRFFVAYRDQIPTLSEQSIVPSGELENIDWIRLDDTNELATARITQLMLDEVRRLIDNGQNDLPEQLPIVQYQERRGRFVREVI